VVRNLDHARREKFLASLNEYVDLQSSLRESTTPKGTAAPATPKRLATPVAAALPPAKRQELASVALPASPPEMLDQGHFGLCSAYAVATSVSHALGAKYGVFVEAGRLLERWFDYRIPEKAQWPDQWAADVGTFRIKTQDAFYDIKLESQVCTQFKDAADAISRCSGFRCVVVVLALGETSGRNHSVVGIRLNCDSTIVCQNSWGIHNEPFMVVTPKSFVRAFWLEPIITARFLPDGKKILSDTPPPALPCWKDMRPL